MERTTPSRSLALALSFLALIWVSPFFWLFTNAFDPTANGVLRMPTAIGLDNFIRALSGNAGRQFVNSLVLAAGLLSPALFAMLVVMALATTAMTGPLLRLMDD